MSFQDRRSHWLTTNRGNVIYIDVIFLTIVSVIVQLVCVTVYQWVKFTFFNDFEVERDIIISSCMWLVSGCVCFYPPDGWCRLALNPVWKVWKICCVHTSCGNSRVGLKCTKVLTYQKYTQVHVRLPIKIPKNHPWSFMIHPTDSTVHGTARGGPCASGSPLGVLFAPKLKIHVKITHSAHFVFYRKKIVTCNFLDFVY